MENSIKFRSMFVVDPQVTSFKDGETIGSNLSITKEHPFNIRNRQVKENGDIIEVGTYREYMNEVILNFFDMLKTSQINAFLSYHYENAKDKKAFMEFIKHDVWDYFTPPLELTTHRKATIKEWIEDVENTGTKQNEPQNKVKAWIVFFEKDKQISVKKGVNQIYIKRSWVKGELAVINLFSAVQKIALKKINKENYKEQLFKAISLMTGESKQKAEKLYLELK